MSFKQTFQKMLTAAGVKYFKADEFWAKGGSHSTPGAKGYKLNLNPPPDLFERMIPTALVLDELRRRLGRPVFISSAFRSPAYNLAIGSTNPPDPHALLGYGSQHPRFCAVDIVSSAYPDAVYGTLLAMRREGFFKGGLGRYNTFTHVDTRPQNATW